LSGIIQPKSQTMISRIVFDIETGPISDQELDNIRPPFDPLDVKTGNIKDPHLIAEKVIKARDAHLREFKERAALDATTGRVLAVGFRDYASGATTQFWGPNEDDILRGVWAHIEKQSVPAEFIGFNIKRFDIPFLVRRSWKHDLRPNFRIIRGTRCGEEVVDLMEQWQLSGNRNEFTSLNTICKHLGLGEKTGTGADFADLAAVNHAAATEYLERDLELTAKLAERIWCW
jgi:hypothetical protein